MKFEDTICYNISECIKELEEAVKTKRLDALKMVQALHKIRGQAYKMEEGLTKRKVVMEKANIEQVYQKTKKSSPSGLNKLPQTEKDGTKTKELIDYEFTVKDNKTGEVLYKNKGWAGVMVFVEKIEDMDEQGVITGTTQKLFYGSNLAIWYAFDQLRQAMETKGTEFLLHLEEMVRLGKLKDPDVKKKVLEAANGIHT